MEMTREELTKRLAAYQSELVGICRELGCDPNVGVADPSYYGDMALEAITNLRASSSEYAVCEAICERMDFDFIGEKDPSEHDDPVSALTARFERRAAESKGVQDGKGHTVIAREGENALVFTSLKSPTPYVIACGYDEKTGEWASGLYRSDLGHAWDEFRPEIMESATIRWQRGDFEAALTDKGIEPTPENVRLLINETQQMKGWRDYAVEEGNEMLEQSVVLNDKLSCQMKPKHDAQEESYSLGSQAQDMRDAINSLDNGTPERHVGRDER